MSLIAAVGLGWAAMALAMLALWAWYRRGGDPGVVDVAWGLGVAALGPWFCLWAEEGDRTRRWVLAGLVVAWGVRLSGHIARRRGRLSGDGRYHTLSEAWGPRAPWYFLGFFQLQATWSVLFALPVLLAATNPAPWPQWSDLVGLGTWLVAVAGEAIADRQLQRFRENPANRGQVCQTGLWRYSRHPNYFCEWLHWWAYVACSGLRPVTLWGLLGPLAMWWFLNRVTGIPPTEAQSLKSRGEAYRRYQQTTSRFFPWPPRAESTP